jgi:hypothetical protein
LRILLKYYGVMNNYELSIIAIYYVCYTITNKQTNNYSKTLD